jgi:predicted glutamine amidotransferase
VVNVPAIQAVVCTMCQLLGMNSLKPASLSFSLEGFLRRGGETDEHADGWGLAYYDAQRCQLLVDEVAAARSQMAEWVQQQHPERSCNVIAHIRKATRGGVTVSNCHPFVRQLWGQEWAFAHNGTLDLAGLPSSFQHFEAVGDTDSERAFCLLVDTLYDEFGECMPALDDVLDCLNTVSQRIAQYGSFNYVLSNGQALLAHRSTSLYYLERCYPFGQAHLLDCQKEIDFARYNHLDDRMVLITTQPLTDECWQPMPVGEVQAFCGGRRLTALSPIASKFAV